MRKSNSIWVIVFVLLIVAAASAVAVDGDEGRPGEPAWVKINVKHRIHTQFNETITVKMHERTQVGDTDFFFEVTNFYPHVAIIDSTKEVISLSNELKNPAFKIALYENDELSEETWAFYAIKVPHYARNSYLAFDALAFEYEGVVYGDEDETDSAKAGE